MRDISLATKTNYIGASDTHYTGTGTHTAAQRRRSSAAARAMRSSRGWRGKVHINARELPLCNYYYY